jgi:hypothetical protein
MGNLIAESTNFDAAPSNLDVLRDLNCVKVLFQAKAIAAVMGLRRSDPTPNSASQTGRMR